MESLLLQLWTFHFFTIFCSRKIDTLKSLEISLSFLVFFGGFIANFSIVFFYELWIARNRNKQSGPQPIYLFRGNHHLWLYCFLDRLYLVALSEEASANNSLRSARKCMLIVFMQKGKRSVLVWVWYFANVKLLQF